jgi:hypothetical protein
MSVNIASEAICPELHENGNVLHARTLRRWRPPQQLPQLGDVGGDASRFMACEQIGDDVARRNYERAAN